jgi:hypothetical protein
VKQQQSRVDEVERCAGDRLVNVDVVWHETAVPVPGCVQHAQARNTERGVHVDANHATGGPNSLGYEAHRLARSAAGVQAAHARHEVDPVQHAPGRGFPHPRLGAQPVVFV